MESEGFLNIQKITSALEKFCSKIRLFWHRVYASRDVGNAAEHI